MISSVTKYLILAVTSAVLVQAGVTNTEGVPRYDHVNCFYQDGQVLPIAEKECLHYGNGVCFTGDGRVITLDRSLCDKYNHRN